VCIICIEFQKEKLTVREAWSNYTEMALDLDDDHRQKVEDMITLAEEKEAMEADFFDFFSSDGSD